MPKPLARLTGPILQNGLEFFEGFGSQLAVAGTASAARIGAAGR